ncbi:MAG: 50S ribosomal protein L18 [Patescibacteria group bacterium]|nr:50S ribosomal protein L18 [Patescibacteria group bacterium]
MTINKKQLGRDNRKRRVRAKISGTAVRPRLCVQRTLKANYAKLIDDETGKTLVAVSDIKEEKGGNLDSAKRVGVKLAEEAKKEKIRTCVFDRSGYKYHGRVRAIAEGAREGGLKF